MSGSTSIGQVSFHTTDGVNDVLSCSLLCLFVLLILSCAGSDIPSNNHPHQWSEEGTLVFFSNVVFQALVNWSEVKSGQKQVEYASIGLGWDRTLPINYKKYSLFYGCYSINIFLRFVCQLPRVDPQPKCPWHKVRLPRLGGWGVGGVNWNLLMLGLFIITWAIVPVCWHSHQVGNRRQSLKREICSCTSLSHRKLYAGFIFF